MGKSGSKYQNNTDFLCSLGRKEATVQLQTTSKCVAYYKILNSKLIEHSNIKCLINWLSDHSCLLIIEVKFLKSM